MRARQIEAAFFDLGGTLGQMDGDKFLPFESTFQLLPVMSSVLTLRLGIITNVPAHMTPMQIKQLLIGVKILKFFDPHGFITSLDAKAAKPDPHIYVYAAKQMGLTTSQCLYIGEESGEVDGACAAGMVGILKRAPLAVQK